MTGNILDKIKSAYADAEATKNAINPPNASAKLATVLTVSPSLDTPNIIAVTESDLKPGDRLFFQGEGTSTSIDT